MKKTAVIAVLCGILNSHSYAGDSLNSSGQLFLASTSLKLPAPAGEQTNWSGFYAGVNGGYGWANNSTQFFSVLPPAPVFRFTQRTISFDSSGFIHGVQVGGDWQLSPSVVLGIETDFEGSSFAGTGGQTISSAEFVTFLGPTFQNTLSTTEKINWFGTFRPVVGMLVKDQRCLLYVTGGFAYAHLENSANSDFYPILERALPASKEATEFGWTAGGGVEWKFTQAISAGLQYLFLDFDSIQTNSTPTVMIEEDALGQLGATITPFNMGYRWFDSANVIKLDLNYRF